MRSCRPRLRPTSSQLLCRRASPWPPEMSRMGALNPDMPPVQSLWTNSILFVLWLVSGTGLTRITADGGNLPDLRTPKFTDVTVVCIWAIALSPWLYCVTPGLGRQTAGTIYSSWEPEMCVFLSKWQRYTTQVRDDMRKLYKVVKGISFSLGQYFFTRIKKMFTNFTWCLSLFVPY